ncbi:MAG: hypothetical protein H6737_19815 [Alphaproteobacteria bacterium]|nr:hypothetical protein [Alphaproteobacteria bacterium]
MRAFFLVFFAISTLPGAALAQESNPFDDLLKDDEDDSFGQKPGDLDTSNKGPEFDEPEGDEPGEDPVGPDGESPDLLDDDPSNSGSLGGDTAELYRQTLQSVKTMEPDDEMQVWDEYLQKYPTSAFRPQIEKRMEQLEDAMYDLNRIHRTEEPEVDADKAQLKFSQGLLIENINPRRRLQFTLEWGLPDYANLGADYEHALLRSLSLHAGVRRRFTGVNVEGGVRWALVKAARTNTLVTFIGDIHLNTSPAYIGFRPQLAAGKRFGKLDLQGQVGVDIAPRAVLDLRIVGGVNATYRASNAVAMFAETSVYMATIGGESGPYRFNQFIFGMKFFPSRKAKDPEKMEVNLGASIPYSSAYWQYHYGSLTGQANVYLD